HFSIIPNGASRAEFESTSAPFRQSYGIPNDRLLLLTVGSHTGEKGHREAIDAFGRARIGRADFVIIGNEAGDRSCLAECRSAARRLRWRSLGRKRVRLMNPPREDVV